jgi:hypothetical protein
MKSKLFIIAGSLLALFILPVNAAVWQWSTEVKSVISEETNEHPVAFLWIPENCKQVRSVIIGQHNMTEEVIFEHPAFRKALTELGFAEIWITPGINIVFDFNKGAGEQFQDILKSLAEVSGYGELEFAPVVPIGHSAYASYPWNFGAWNPERTLAILSIHGDAPLTNLTGSGRPNPEWGNRNTNGVPGLMVEGEYEWREDRVKPAFDYQEKHPESPVSFLTDAGHGHFDISDGLIDYLALFLKKAAKYRLPNEMPLYEPVKLIPVYPRNGWIADRWHKDEKPHASASSYSLYKGDRKTSFWYFDKDMAIATEKYYSRVRGKKEQYLGFTQNGVLLPFNQNSHARILAKFIPGDDGLTFHICPAFTDSLRSEFSNNHAAGKPVILRICGPVEKINDTTFTVRFYRMGLNNIRRTNEIWLMASNEGDKKYKSSVQQMNMHIPYRNSEGSKQTITFKQIDNVTRDTKSINLDAKSDCNLPVYFYVKEGPAEIKNNKIYLTRMPPRSKYPVKVTVVAWQYGRSSEPKIQTAEPVEIIFYIE